MIEIKAPVYSTYEPFYEIVPRSVFLAGGITNCADWRRCVVESLSNEERIVFNPRRDDFDITNESSSKIQIDWEFKHLKCAAVVAFWFPWETLCPISLFELGKFSKNHSCKLIVGVDPEYKRKFDVIEQLRRERPALVVHQTFDDFLEAVKKTV